MFACQRDSYLTEFQTCVKRVEDKGDFLEVDFEDTILFPEGGGQNSDQGFAGQHKVVKVFRLGDRAVHCVESVSDKKPLSVNDTVLLKVDWTRRFDNMQQHTGQHLLSALLEKNHGLQTKSWWMAENNSKEVGVSYIELRSSEEFKSSLEDVLTAIEAEANECIRKHTPVTVSTYSKNDEELKKAHTRGLPEDLPNEALIRIVDVIGDKNLCCGTHVANLAHLQLIKILSIQKLKKTNDFTLYFLVGDRVSRYVTETYAREKELTSLLNNRPLDHSSLVSKVLQSSKVIQKTNSALLKELAKFEADNIKKQNPVPKFVCVHRKEGNSEYIGTLIQELTLNREFNVFLFVIVGDGKDGIPYQMALSGDADRISSLGPKICDLLDGKGGGRHNRFNAKVYSIKNLDKAFELIQRNFA